jgi:hypothetical protein
MSTERHGGKPAPLSDAIQKNKQATEEVKDAADDLFVVHTVLDKELPKDPKSKEAKEAVSQTKKIEKRLSSAAKKLDGVNEALQREARTRTGN